MGFGKRVAFFVRYSVLTRTVDYVGNLLLRNNKKRR